MAFWNLSLQHRQSFLGGSCRYGSIEEPNELVSCSSSSSRLTQQDSGRPGKRAPMFFMTKSNVDEAVRCYGSMGGRLRMALRKGIALCVEWNDLGNLYLLDVAPGSTVEAWIGLAKFQPATHRGEGGPVLPGGWLQYIIDIDDKVLANVRGPIPTGW